MTHQSNSPHHSPSKQSVNRTAGMIPTYMRLLQLAWKQYIARFDLILLVNLLIAGPLFLVVDWSMPRALLAESNLLQSTTFMDWFARSEELTQIVLRPEFLSHIAIQFLVKICLVYVICVIVLMLKHHYYRKTWTRQQLFQKALRVFPKAALTLLIIQIMVGLGYVLFIIPGLILEIVLSLAVPMLVWYNLSPIKAIVRSLQVGFRNWWFVLSYIIITQLLVEVVSAVVIAAMPDQFGLVAIGLTITHIFTSFTTVFIVLLMTAMDIKLVKAQPLDSSVTKSTT